MAGAAVLARLPDVTSDNGLPRWLGTEAGVIVRDLRTRWRLQLDLDSPLDALLIAPGPTAARLAADGIDTEAVRDAIRAVGRVTRDAGRELIVAGRASAAGLARLERTTASRTRALIEERGFRTRAAGQRPVRSTLGSSSIATGRPPSVRGSPSWATRRSSTAGSSSPTASAQTKRAGRRRRTASRRTSCCRI